MKVKRKHSIEQRPPGGKDGDAAQQLIQLLLESWAIGSEELKKTLSGIKAWPFEEIVDLNQWFDVLDTFDTILEQSLTRFSTQLLHSNAPAAGENDDTADAASTLVYEVLRFSTLLLQNSFCKSVYNSIEHIIPCLRAKDHGIAYQSIVLLAALVTPPPSNRCLVDPASTSSGGGNFHFSPTQLQKFPHLVSNLIDLATSAASVSSSSSNTSLVFGSSETLLKFLNDGSISSSGVRQYYSFYHPIKNTTVEIPLESDQDLAQLVTRYEIPEKFTFSLLARLNSLTALKNTNSSTRRLEVVMSQFYALIVLVHAFLHVDLVREWLQQQPDLIPDIVELIRPPPPKGTSTTSIAPQEIQLVAVQALTAFLLDPSANNVNTTTYRALNIHRALGIGRRGSSNSGSSGGGSGVLRRGILYTLVRQLFLYFSTTSSTSTIPTNADEQQQHQDSTTDLDDLGLGVAFVEATMTKTKTNPDDATVCNNTSNVYRWMEAILRLMEAATNSQQGVTALFDYDILSDCFKLLDCDPPASPMLALLHAHCAQLVELMLINHSATAVQYRELNYFPMLIHRLQQETEYNTKTWLRSPSTTAAALEEKETKDTEEVVVLLPLHRKIVIFSILNLICMSFHAQGAIASSSCNRILGQGEIVSVLNHILTYSSSYGGSILAHVCTLLSDMIQNEPTCTNMIHTLGIAKLFLERIIVAKQIPAVPECLLALPGTISALSMTTSGATQVEQYPVFDTILGIFVDPAFSPPFSNCLHGDLPAIIGSSLEELMRQVEPFRAIGMKACVDTIQKIVQFSCQTSTTEAGITTEQQERTVLHFVTHIAQVLEPILTKSELASVFADVGGVDALLALYPLTLPSTRIFLKSIKKTSDPVAHFPAANALSITIRAFGAQHPIILLNRVIREMEVQLEKLAAARISIGLPSQYSLVRFGAEGILTSIENIPLEQLLKEEATTTTTSTIDTIATYLRYLAMIEWLICILSAMLRTAHCNVQHHRWFNDFMLPKNLDVVDSLYKLNSSILWEVSSMHAATSFDPKCLKDIDGIRDIAYHLLQRYARMSRNVLVSFSKTFHSIVPPHRRHSSSSNSIPSSLVPHANPMMAFTCRIISTAFAYALAPDRASLMRDNEHAFSIQLEYLTQMLWTIDALVYDERKPSSHIILQYHLMTSLMSKAGDDDGDASRTTTARGILQAIEVLLQFCVNNNQRRGDTERSRHQRKRSFSIAIQFVQHFMATGTLLQSSTSKLFQNLNYSASPTQIALDLQLCTLRLIVPLWRAEALDQFRQLPITQGLSVWIPFIIQLSVTQHVLSKALAEEEAASDEQQAQGQTDDSGNRTEPQEPDPEVVNQLVAMGFSHELSCMALRQIEPPQTIQVAMDWILAHPEGIPPPVETMTDATTTDDATATTDADPPKPPSTLNELKGLWRTFDSVSPGLIFDLVLSQTARENDKDIDMDKKALVLLGAQFFSGFCQKSRDHCQAVLSLFVAHFDEAAGSEAKLSYGIVHVFALLMQCNTFSRQVYMDSYGDVHANRLLEFFQQHSSTIATAEDGQEEPIRTCMLLIFDAFLKPSEARMMESIKSKDDDETKTEAKEEQDDDTRALFLVPKAWASRLLDICIDYLSYRKTRMNTATPGYDTSDSEAEDDFILAIIQVLSRLTRSYGLTRRFLQSKGLECVFSAVSQSRRNIGSMLGIARHVVEEQDGLRVAMEKEIHDTLQALSQRYGPPSQMRISPRVFQSAVVSMIYRHPVVFQQAVSNCIVYKKSDIGRWYVDEKEQEESKKEDKDKPTSAGQSLQQLMSIILTKCIETRCREESLVLLQLITELIVSFPSGAVYVHQFPAPPSPADGLLTKPEWADRGYIITHVLQRMVPTPEYMLRSKVCRKSHKISKKTKLESAELVETGQMGTYFILTLCHRGGEEGCRRVLSEVCWILKHWTEIPLVQRRRKDQDKEKEDAEPEDLIWSNDWTQLWMLQSWIELVFVMISDATPHAFSSRMIWENIKVLSGLQFAELIVSIIDQIDLSIPIASTLVSSILQAAQIVGRTQVLKKLHEWRTQKEKDKGGSKGNQTQLQSSSNSPCGGNTTEVETGEADGRLSTSVAITTTDDVSSSRDSHLHDDDDDDVHGSESSESESESESEEDDDDDDSQENDEEQIAVAMDIEEEEDDHNEEDNEEDEDDPSRPFLFSATRLADDDEDEEEEDREEETEEFEDADDYDEEAEEDLDEEDSYHHHRAFRNSAQGNAVWRTFGRRRRGAGNLTHHNQDDDVDDIDDEDDDEDQWGSGTGDGVSARDVESRMMADAEAILDNILRDGVMSEEQDGFQILRRGGGGRLRPFLSTTSRSSRHPFRRSTAMATATLTAGAANVNGEFGGIETSRTASTEDLHRRVLETSIRQAERTNQQQQYASGSGSRRQHGGRGGDSYSSGSNAGAGAPPPPLSLSSTFTHPLLSTQSIMRPRGSNQQQNTTGSTSTYSMIGGRGGGTRSSGLSSVSLLPSNRHHLANPLEAIGLASSSGSPQNPIDVGRFSDMELQIPTLERGGWRRYNLSRSNASRMMLHGEDAEEENGRGGGVGTHRLFRSSNSTGSTNNPEATERWTDDGQALEIDTLSSTFETELMSRLMVVEEEEQQEEQEQEEAKEEEGSVETSSIIELADTLGESTLQTPPTTGIEEEASNVSTEVVGTTTTETESVAMEDTTMVASSSSSPSPMEMTTTAAALSPPIVTEDQTSSSATIVEVPPLIETTTAAEAAAESTTTTPAPPPAPTTATTTGPMMDFTLDFSSVNMADSRSTEGDVEQQEETDETTSPSAEAEAEARDGGTALICPEGMDPDVFAQLPIEMQHEVIAANPAPQTATADASSLPESSFDPETLAALPEDIRQEVLAQERREREEQAQAAANPSNAQEMDNASFVASLAPELRDEILMTSDDAFLATLPAALRAEAQVLRDRAASQFHSFGGFFQRSSVGMDAANGSGAQRSSTLASRRARREAIRLAAEREAWLHFGQVKCDTDWTLSYTISEKGLIAMLQCMFLSTPIRGRVLQRILHQAGLYQASRRVVCFRLFQILSRVLPDSNPSTAVLQSNLSTRTSPFPCTLYEKMSRKTKEDEEEKERSAGSLPTLVIRRLLDILLTCCRLNPHFKLEVLESYMICLINVINAPVFTKNSAMMEKLILVLRHVVSPIRRMHLVKKPPEGQQQEEEESKTDNTAAVAASATTDPSTEAQDSMADPPGVMNKKPKQTWYKIPQPILSRSDCQVLIQLISSSDMCRDKAMTQASEIVATIATVPSNRLEILNQLIVATDPLIQKIRVELTQDTTSEASVNKHHSYELEVLRLVKCILSIVKDEKKTKEEDDGEGDEDHQQQIGSDLRLKFRDLFAPLSTRLHAIEQELIEKSLSDENASSTAGDIATTIPKNKTTTVKVPPHLVSLIELFFIVETIGCSPSSSTNATIAPTLVVTFVEHNRRVLNAMIRDNPMLLSTSLKPIVEFPKCRVYLEFDNKRHYFRAQMRKLRQSAHRKHGSIRLQIRREQVFEDSFNSLRMRTADEMRGRLHITFHREEGIDAGGLTREWYVILSREIFNPNYALFTTAANNPTFQPNPLSVVNKDHLEYFKFVGRIIGKAICDGQLLDAHFTRSFYKHVLGLPITYHDIEAIDPEYYRNLQSLLNNSLETLGLELTFSVEEFRFGKLQIHDLKPNGRSIPVDEENKMEYIKLVAHHRMTTGIQDQIQAFMQGFHDLIAPEYISIFNENELELLISGMPEIDIDDLKLHTEYSNYTASDSLIRWFWNTLYSFSHEERALFLQFVTGTSKVPLEGFKALEGMRGIQQFNIHKAFGSPQTLPCAHTCFNQLDLPDYPSEQILKERLLFAIREGSEGFGFG